MQTTGIPLPAKVLLDAVARFGSPLYVYDACAVRAAWGAFVAAFGYPHTELHYAIVCNKNRYLVQLLARLGAGVHANTPGDAFAALEAGVPAGRIVYSGTNLDAADFEFLLARGIRMNLDSLDQLADLARAGGQGPVGLRLLIDDEDRPNRIGVTPAELARAHEVLAGSALSLAGLHMYCGTNTTAPGRFLAGMDLLIAASDQVPALEYLDIGGGFGVGYGENEAGLPLAEVGAAISAKMTALSARRGHAVRLVVEPGRAIVAASGTLVTRVVSLKERGGRRYVGVDATVGNMAAESVYHTNHRMAAVAPRGEPLELPTDVCGNTTHSRDYLGRRLRLPRLERGDLLALLDMGAYAYAMSSHFLNRPRPAEAVYDGERLVLTTRRETLADLLDTQVTS